MGVKKLAAVVILAVVLAFAGFAAERIAQHRLHNAVALFRSKLGPGDSFTYRSASPALWRLGADFTEVRLRRGAMLLTAPELALSHVGERRVGRAVLQGATLASGGISLHAERIEISDARATRPGDLDASGAQLGNVRVGGVRITGIDARLPAAAAGLGVRVASFSFDQAPGPGGLSQRSGAEGLEIRDPDGASLLSGAGGRQASSTRGDATVSQWRFYGLSTGQQGMLAQAVGQLGYHGLSGDGSGTARFGASSGRLDFGPAIERFDGVGRIESRLALEGVSSRTLPELDPASWAKASLTGGSLSFEDRGLAARLLRVFASRSGMAPDQFRDVLVAALRQRLAAGPQPMFEQAFEQAALRFLADPRRFTVTLQPPAPLPLAALATLRDQAASDAARSLGLGISAE